MEQREIEPDMANLIKRVAELEMENKTLRSHLDDVVKRKDREVVENAVLGDIIDKLIDKLAR